jgi:hypothetical protein
MTAWSSVAVPSRWRGTSARPRACRTPRSPVGSVARRRRSRRTSTIRRGRRLELSRLATRGCAATVVPTPGRGTARATRRRTARLAPRRDPRAREPWAGLGAMRARMPATGWLTASYATPIRVRRRRSASGPLLHVVQTSSDGGIGAGGCSANASDSAGAPASRRGSGRLQAHRGLRNRGKAGPRTGRSRRRAGWRGDQFR